MTQYDREVNRLILAYAKPTNTEGYYTRVIFWDPFSYKTWSLENVFRNGTYLRFNLENFSQHLQIIEDDIIGSVLIKYGARNTSGDSTSNNFAHYKYQQLVIKNPSTNQKYIIRSTPGVGDVISILPEGVKRKKYNIPLQPKIRHKDIDGYYLDEEEEIQAIIDEDYRRKIKSKPKSSRKIPKKVIKKCTCKNTKIKILKNIH